MRSIRLKFWLSRLPLLLFAILLSAGFMLQAAAASGTPPSQPAALGPAVYVVPVKQTVESGLQAFLQRAYREAEQAQAETVILVINTLGGRVDSAEEIGELIRSSPVPTVAFVEGKAISAGTYLALNAEQIVMQKVSTMGAASVVDGSGTLIDNPKVISFWVEQMKAAALMNGRDPDIAVAMVDPAASLHLEAINRTVNAGQVLTLNAEDAVKVGYAEFIAESPEAVLSWLGLENRTVIELNPSPAENVARFVTSPLIMTVLLILGIAGVAIELLIPGFGVPGILGIAAFGLYFFGHYIAGFAGMESVVLFVIGVVLLLIEVFVPSFGILGILGIVSLVSGVVTAAYDKGNAAISLSIAFAVSVVLIVIFSVVFKKRGIWNRFVLSDRLTTEQGYIPAASKADLIGISGTALTALRPAGVMETGSERIDVVTSGEFISQGSKVKVIKVEGTRVVVKEIE